MTVPLSVVEASRPEGLGESAALLLDKVADLSQAIAAQHQALAALGGAWQGRGSAVALTRAGRELARQQRVRDELGAVQSALSSGGSQLSAIRLAVMGISGDLRARGWLVTDAGAVVAPPVPALFGSLEGAFTAILQRLLAMFTDADAATASAVGNALGPLSTRDDTQEMSHGFGAGGAPLSPREPAPEDDRRRNQVAAFRAATGREPGTPNDWKAAAILDPHTYAQKNRGVQSNVVVGHINPVPGQGVVQTNLFIPGEEAWYPDVPGGISGHNFGDHRGFNPSAGPEESRVVLFVDYDNGLVVARQNPSVDTARGDVMVGTPHVKVSQNHNGSVLIDYRAADPFAPGGESPAPNGLFNVNGQLALKPTPDGPIAGGVVSSFPAIEIYGHGSDGTSEIAKIMPQNVGQAGPLFGLPLSQNIGTPLMGEFPDTVLLPPAGVPNIAVPLEPGELPPVARLPSPVVVPYPSTVLGSVADNVRVPLGSQR